jgi:outer membrane protein OmpA-like peptidoglycan-associated protein
MAKGKIYSNETHQVVPSVTMTITNFTENKIDTIKLDASGEYAVNLLSDHKYKIEASKDGYITNGFELNTQNVKRDTLLNDIVLEETYVDKVIIHFDYAKNTIRADSRMELDKIIRNLKKYKETTVQISAHADSRGPKPYNQTLSDNRAKASMDYFVSKGIPKERIEARGFGEELLLNRCSDGVTCTEVEHTLNRRAEVKVQSKR